MLTRSDKKVFVATALYFYLIAQNIFYIDKNGV